MNATTMTKPKNELLDLIIRADQLDQICPKGWNNLTRIAIFNHRISLAIIEKGIFHGLKITFRELKLLDKSQETHDFQEILEQSGYKVYIKIENGYEGYYFEILRG